MRTCSPSEHKHLFWAFHVSMTCLKEPNSRNETRFRQDQLTKFTSANPTLALFVQELGVVLIMHPIVIAEPVASSPAALSLNELSRPRYSNVHEVGGAKRHLQRNLIIGTPQTSALRNPPPKGIPHRLWKLKSVPLHRAGYQMASS